MKLYLTPEQHDGNLIGIDVNDETAGERIGWIEVSITDEGKILVESSVMPIPVVTAQVT